jgi:hypothetical protein
MSGLGMYCVEFAFPLTDFGCVCFIFFVHLVCIHGRLLSNHHGMFMTGGM